MNKREIVWDTETTGLDPFSGDKIVEIGAVELINHVRTGKTFHQYINPMRSMSEEVIHVHGLTEEFLSDKPTFAEICDDFLAFIGEDADLVAHNASFDMRFLNYELKVAGRGEIGNDRVVDTLLIARKKFPGQRASLDELCRRFEIDSSHRTFHGALLDSELLAEVYLELLGGAEPGFFLNAAPVGQEMAEMMAAVQNNPVRAARVFDFSADELAAHAEFLKKLKNPMWEEA